MKTDLKTSLASMAPKLLDEEYVFCSIAHGSYGDLKKLCPIASFTETEGLSLVVPKTNADRGKIGYQATFKCISLTVHSGLEAVGLTAAVAARLAERGISANVIAAFYHDHIFVPAERAEEALATLLELAAFL